LPPDPSRPHLSYFRNASFFFRREAAAGEITSKSSAVVFADYLLTLHYGLAVMARNGARRKALNAVIDHAVYTFRRFAHSSNRSGHKRGPKTARDSEFPLSDERQPYGQEGLSIELRPRALPVNRLRTKWFREIR